MRIIQGEKTEEVLEREERSKAELSNASELLNRLRKSAGNTFVEFSSHGEEFLVKKLNYSELVELALSVSRDGHDVLNIQRDGGMQAVTVAVILGTVYLPSKERMFTVELVEEFVSEPAAAALVSALFAQAIKLNPGIFSVPTE